MRAITALLLALTVAAGAEAAEKLVAAHFMHQMSVGVDTNPRDSILGIEPGRSNGIKALHTPDYLQYYAMPDAAAGYDMKMMRSGGIDAIGNAVVQRPSEEPVPASDPGLLPCGGGEWS